MYSTDLNILTLSPFPNKLDLLKKGNQLEWIEFMYNTYIIIYIIWLAIHLFYYNSKFEVDNYIFDKIIMS